LASFARAVRVLGGEAVVEDVHANLLSAWSEPGRHYHTLQHLSECLALAREWGGELAPVDSALLVVALWFHDAVYDVRKSDNEEKSAELAIIALARLGVASPFRERVGSLVLATRHGTPVAAGDVVTDMLLDIDLAILGAPPSRFNEYEAQIRQEYHWVSDAVFAIGRGKVLDFFREQAFGALASQPTLYRTNAGRSLLVQARLNLAPPLQ
jgi:predicted metal-dependent HD superfamily phosphohydrolase